MFSLDYNSVGKRYAVNYNYAVLTTSPGLLSQTVLTVTSTSPGLKVKLLAVSLMENIFYGDKRENPTIFPVGSVVN